MIIEKRLLKQANKLLYDLMVSIEYYNNSISKGHNNGNKKIEKAYQIADVWLKENYENIKGGNA